MTLTYTAFKVYLQLHRVYTASPWQRKIC